MLIFVTMQKCVNFLADTCFPIQNTQKYTLQFLQGIQSKSELKKFCREPAEGSRQRIKEERRKWSQP